ncbi:MAG TPA: M20/M25/M40 family metallo-hydrolase [Jatrophihabitantaceae bacterium]|jgi:acetylornithine deacetylase/succinyl-diaminopimelate desuccinylase-like protein
MSPDLRSQVVDLCAQLIRFDTTNYGDGKSTGEREAADWVASLLSDVGYAPTVIEAARSRGSTIVRIPGRDRAAPGLLVHGHLDVVPAEAGDWSVDPFSGEVRDGAVWGRGALDMKGMDAMMLAVALSWGRDGFVPPRDIVLAFVADEEDNGDYGARYLVRQHSELLAGVTSAIGESGGYSVHLPDGSRLYPIATAERGTARVRLTARGPAGHGSRRNPDNAVAALARSVARLADHRWPLHLTPTVSTLLDGLGAHLGQPIDPTDLTPLGDAARLVETTLSNTLNPTMLNAGYKVNVIPSEATAWLDGRLLPGAADDFFTTVQRLVTPGVTVEIPTYTAPVSTSHESPEFAAMADAVRAHDPAALVLPFCLGGGTDAKAFAELGIACYGFAPGRWPVGFAHDSYFHGVDEHVPIESLAFGVGVLDTYLRSDAQRGSGSRGEG